MILPNAHFHSPLSTSLSFSQDKALFFQAFGIHPWDVTDKSTPIPTNELLNYDAIGEIGLDFSLKRAPTQDHQQHQIALLKQQLAQAKALNKPAILHLVQAWEPFLATLKSSSHSTPLMLHRYTGNHQQIQALLKIHPISFFSFAQFNLDYSPKKALAIKECPIDNLLLEDESVTDATAPNPDFFQFYQDVAKFREIPLQTLIETIAKNLKTFYNKS